MGRNGTGAGKFPRPFVVICYQKMSSSGSQVISRLLFYERLANGCQQILFNMATKKWDAAKQEPL